MEHHTVIDLYTDPMFKEMTSWTKVVKRIIIYDGSMDKDAKGKILATIEWTKPNFDLRKMFATPNDIVPLWHYILTTQNGNIRIWRTKSYHEAQTKFLMELGELAEGEP